MAKLKKRAVRVLRDYVGWAQALRRATPAGAQEAHGGAESNGGEPGPDGVRLYRLVALEAALEGWEELKGRDETLDMLLDMEEHRTTLCRLARRARRFRRKGLGRDRGAWTPDLERWADDVSDALAAALESAERQAERQKESEEVEQEEIAAAHP
jgi:hypothetical protein